MANVPVIVGSSHPKGFSPSFACVGTTWYHPPVSQYNQSAWWWLQLDLSNNLKLVSNEITTDGYTIPADVKANFGNPNIFLILASNWMYGQYFPQDPMSSFLIQVGAQKILPRLEQVVSQAGTGYFTQLSYILAATMSDKDLPGIEQYSPTWQTLAVFQFMPISVAGKTIYTPIESYANPGPLGVTANAAAEAPSLVLPAQ